MMCGQYIYFDLLKGVKHLITIILMPIFISMYSFFGINHICHIISNVPFMYVIATAVTRLLINRIINFLKHDYDGRGYHTLDPF